jgi:hypothetical protein
VAGRYRSLYRTGAVKCYFNKSMEKRNHGTYGKEDGKIRKKK